MSTRRHEERTRGRELALVTACALAAHPAPDAREVWDLLWAEPPGGEGGAALTRLLADDGVRAQARTLLEAWLAARADIDGDIEAVSARWRVARMDRVDLAAIRLGAAELRTCPATPVPVVLAEFVRLATRYGSARSGPFVNGVLASLARRLRPTPAPAGGEPAS